jgi:hypothetical protein
MPGTGAIQAEINIFWMSATSMVVLTTSDIWESGNVQQKVHLELRNDGNADREGRNIVVQVLLTSPMCGERLHT